MFLARVKHVLRGVLPVLWVLLVEGKSAAAADGNGFHSSVGKGGHAAAHGARVLGLALTALVPLVPSSGSHDTVLGSQSMLLKGL